MTLHLCFIERRIYELSDSGEEHMLTEPAPDWPTCIDRIWRAGLQIDDAEALVFKAAREREREIAREARKGTPSAWACAVVKGR